MMHPTPLGIDAHCAATVRFRSGVLASILSGIDGNSDTNAWVYGSEGYLRIRPFTSPIRSIFSATASRRRPCASHMPEMDISLSLCTPRTASGQENWNPTSCRWMNRSACAGRSTHCGGTGI